jgi:hypothetical protein
MNDTAFCFIHYMSGWLFVELVYDSLVVACGLSAFVNKYKTPGNNIHKGTPLFQVLTVYSSSFRHL